MSEIKLINYSVNGIKCLEKEVQLSFYKKYFGKLDDFNKYNVKGIYGTNGSGKSAIIASVDILRNVIFKDNYLGNDLVQKELIAIINKKINRLESSIEYLVNLSDMKSPLLYKYSYALSKGKDGRYRLIEEYFGVKKARSKNADFKTILSVSNFMIKDINIKSDVLKKKIIESSQNLLDKQSIMSILFYLFVFDEDNKLRWEEDQSFTWQLLSLFILYKNLHVYKDQGDKHEGYIINDYLFDVLKIKTGFQDVIRSFVEQTSWDENELSEGTIVVPKDKYKEFTQEIEKLCDFLKIFKKNLEKIAIDKKVDKDDFKCRLILKYPDYSIDAEFESTGIKKLIRLFPCIKAMCDGDIVFIDEMDSNIHDVYLCALLEHMTNYGKGQLCFTSHNIGPMDVLKRRKKSIDFLSVNQNIYSWANNGNYSPAQLYKNGMIEGSPFNIDSVDFLSVLCQTKR